MFVDVLRSWAARQPDRIALTFLEDGETGALPLSYSELDRRARETAVGLGRFARPGEHVLLLHPPGLEFVTAFFGCFYAGVIPVPAYPPRNPRHYPRIESILADASVRCVLTETAFHGRLSAWLEQRASETTVVCTDELTGDADLWRPAVDTTFDTVAFLQYTSGSTGEPKGVMVTHGNLMANQHMIRDAFGHAEGLIQVSWLPVYHDMGLIGNLMQPLFLGGHCVFMSPVAFLQKPFRWLAAITRYRAQGSGGPNFSLRLCSRSITDEQKTELDLSSLQVFFVGSEPINKSVLEEFAFAFRGTGFRREALYCCYGMAETTLLATGSTPGAGPLYEFLDADALASGVAETGDPFAARCHTITGCGKAAGGLELTIVNPATGTPVGDGIVGEIRLRGPNITPGYWRKPELNSITFGPEGAHLRTGDLGYKRNGELFVTGRIKDLIIVRGRNHYPQDIEETVDGSHPALAPNGSAAVLVQTGESEGVAIVCEVQRSMLRSVNVDEVFARVRSAVFDGHELNPVAIALIRPATLPRTSSGKIQRWECRAQYAAGTLDTIAFWRAPAGLPLENSPNAPASPVQGAITSAAVETWLRTWISARLGKPVSTIDAELAFADSGLDSVSAVELSSDLSQWVGLEVSPTLVWDFPTLRMAAEYLAGQADSPEDAADLLARELASLNEETY